MKLIEIVEEEVHNHREYLKWKRNNVTLRGVKELGKENNVYGSLGKGLYTAFLSNKQMAKEYGNVYFVVGAKPNKPKIFNTLNEWEIWFQNNLVFKYSKEKGKNYPDIRDFTEKTTIEKELLSMGYDGIIIKGREIVNFKPNVGNIKYFKTEEELINYYQNNVSNE